LDVIKAKKLDNLKEQNEELSLVKEFLFWPKSFWIKKKFTAVQVKSFVGQQYNPCSESLQQTKYCKSKSLFILIPWEF